MKGKLKGSKIMALTLSAIIALPSVAYAATEAHVLHNPQTGIYTQFNYLQVRGSYNEYKNTDDLTKGSMYRAYKDGGELVGIYDDKSEVYIDYYRLLDEYTQLREKYPNMTLEDRQKILDELQTFQEEKVTSSDLLKNADGSEITIKEIDSEGQGGGTITIDAEGQARGVKSVTVTPDKATISAKGGTEKFEAAVDVMGGVPKTVTWSIAGASSSTSSTITQDGFLTVGAADAGKTITVRATSTYDVKKFGTAIVTVGEATVDPISLKAIAGVAAPVKGATPVTSITETAQYTGTVAWSPAHATFQAGTVYTATIAITPKADYTLTGVAQNFFTVAGATTVANTANSGTVTAVFPATLTDPVQVTGVAITGTAKVNSTLAATVQPAGAPVTYKWYRSDNVTSSGSAIDGATNSTYVLTSDDLDKYVYVVIGAVTGQTIVADGTSSNYIGPVEAADPEYEFRWFKNQFGNIEFKLYDSAINEYIDKPFLFCSIDATAKNFSTAFYYELNSSNDFVVASTETIMAMDGSRLFYILFSGDYALVVDASFNEVPDATTQAKLNDSAKVDKFNQQ